MKNRIKIWHLSLLIPIAILIARFELWIGSWGMILSFLELMIEDFSLSLGQLDLALTDHIIASKLIIFLPIIILIFRKSPLLSKEISFSSVSIILILTAFLFAPYLTTANPNFQKNIGVTRLLPPFSSVQEIKKIKPEKDRKEKADNFLYEKERILKQSIDADLEYADSTVRSGGELNYFQRGKRLTVDGEKAEVRDKTFILGTDEYGRDVYSRLIYGVRISLLVGLGATVISLLLGLSLGFVSGFSGGIIDTMMNRFTETFLAFPILFLIILILALFGSSLFWVVIVLGFSGWMSLFKIVRGEVLRIKQIDYFISASMIGLRKRELLLKEVLPVVMAPLVVNLVFQYGNVILAESTLSYLGLGAGDQYPSWGKMIDQGQAYIGKAWWLIFFPGLALVLTLFTANRIGRDINREINPNLKNDQ